MIRCGECRHWRKIRDENYQEWRGPHGECHLLDEFSTEKSAWLDLWIGPLEPDEPVKNAAGEASLITMPDFGCVHGELKA